ncbi:AI-2E family transporter [Roseovarius autotrophicus]|uniref:AI-2E family transporter n=1 Tax=Roseovarius autotrophicus TaxID=2824121 RepID=UPI0019F8DEA1|nr:AI-2E family transporter [Roseovarius autotrophicus]MBE0453514.1 AI-2E family transporter [Roseovarius sp.]
MALPVRDQVKYWSLTAAAGLAMLWVLGDVILPFVLGAAVAYFLDPIADRLERMGLGRLWAVVVIVVLGLMAMTVLALLVVPMLVQQAAALFNTAPQLVARLQGFLFEHFPQLDQADSALRQSLAGVGETIRERGAQLIQTLLTSAASLLNIVVLLIVAPVVAFYLLYDWDRMLASIDDLLPRDHAPVIRRLAREIDATLAGFIRGMGTVCLIMATYYGLGLMAVGLQFGLAVGVFAGLITFIPYLGAILGGIVAIGLALFQFWGDWLSVGLVAAVFGAGQMFESNFMTPRLVGRSVGLHPVWVLFALSVFGALFGLVGFLVAVPMAAAIGVIARFGIAEYKQSRLYRGLDGERDKR